MENYTFHIKGMTCSACTHMAETELMEVKGMVKVKASLRKHTVKVYGEFDGKTETELIAQFNKLLKPHNYSLSIEKESHKVKWQDFNTALPIASVFIALFILLQKAGFVNLVSSSDVSYMTAALIGFIASISTCMAVVGGLVLSMSANFAKEGDKIKPQILFHIGRLISFFILGGVIGALGSSFQLGNTGNFIMSLVVGLILLILGLNLLDIFPSAKKLQITLPKFFSKHIHELKKINHSLTPFLVGAVTFFLPCGFTQSMQIYTLSTGSFWSGALIMTAFALGTLPVLAILSFSSSAVHKKAQSSIFFKTAGLIVLFFAVFNILNSFAAAGLINPIFSF